MRVRRKIWKSAGFLIRPFSRWYFRKPRQWKYDDLCFIILPGVFHPHLTTSTKTLLDWIKTQEIEGKTLLELGCGSGVISVYTSIHGAKVTASDISDLAIKNTTDNASAHKVKIDIIKNDLLNGVDINMYDYILINPPFYNKTPGSIEETAWFCGNNFEYFHKLFEQLNTSGSYNNVIMILSQDANTKEISIIAQKYGQSLELIYADQNVHDTNLIYRLSPIINTE